MERARQGHPADLGSGQPRARAGRPVLADRMVAEQVLGRLQRLSAMFSTEVEHRDGRGTVTLAGSSAQEAREYQ